ncbi:MAG: hypothetical protein QWI36_04940 [Wolbachia endosymbiont of Tyrophagus putrescentiae]|nr:hypothetical protein [Wolbachia endosymbiont of Tyrophagus putrescentiae]
MPKMMERHAQILEELQKNIYKTDGNDEINAGRSLAVERWVKTYAREVEYLKNNDELKFLSSIFRDSSCWSGSGIELNNKELGKRLTEERNKDGRTNPLSRYNMACRYCVTDKIYNLFSTALESYRNSFSSKVERELSTDESYVRSELLRYMKGKDPVFGFWIDENSGVFKEHNDDLEDSFNKAVEFKWSEGVKHFYDLLPKRDKEKKITEAIVKLSSVQCDHNGAIILNFCLSNMTVGEIHKLLKDSGKLYPLLNALIHQGFFNRVERILPIFEGDVLKEATLSPQEYSLLLSSLSDMVLGNENPEGPLLSRKYREIISDLLKCGNFIDANTRRKEKEDVFRSVSIECAIETLIVDLKRCAGSRDAKDIPHPVHDILRIARDFPESYQSLKDSIVEDLIMVKIDGMEENVQYDKLAKELFESPNSSLTGLGLGLSGHEFGRS